MKISNLFPLVFFLFFSLAAAEKLHKKDLFRCLSKKFKSSYSEVVYTPNNKSYLSILQFSIQNLWFTEPGTPQPIAIITPLEESDVGKAIHCCRKHEIQIRTRSGGHDFEGVSFVSNVTFAIIDLFKLRNITVDAEAKTAWVQTGATLGEVYYSIANKSRTLAFPAGICPTVGTGGHISGGGYGMLVRRFGMAADHVIDARIVDVKGRILDRESMGETVFWAIRGGGGGSFGVVVAWKLRLVEVPENVTVFTVVRTLEQNATDLVDRWQYIADKIDNNLLLRILLRGSNATADGSRTIQAIFTSLYLGGIDSLVSLMEEQFPGLGLTKADCTEMSWVESVLVFIQGDSLEYLLNRTYPYKENYKLKADFVKEPIPKSVFEGIWKMYEEEQVEVPLMVLTPWGGVLNEISSSQIAFPHRAGRIYLIEYQVGWIERGQAAYQRHVGWLRGLYDYMTPYVSKNPREAYLNYRDFEIGVNSNYQANVTQASEWGIRYFLDNYWRLVIAKTLIEPKNFFRHEQSIPPLSSRLME